MSSLNFENLKRFIIRQRGTYKFELRKDLDLEIDLKIYGDDVGEFIEAFSNEFTVDVSRFDASKYFSPEGDVLIRKIVSWILRKNSNSHIPRVPITLGDLEKAIETKILE